MAVTALVAELRALGVSAGDVLMVHASMRRVGGDAGDLVQAIDEAVAPNGTWMMTLGARDDWSWVNERPEAERAALLAGSPVFDALTAPADPDVGVLAEVFRTTPGTLVSDHPEGRFGARGSGAAELMADVPWDDYYGAGSPLDRFVRCRGRVLRLGADVDTVTLLHWAEWSAPIENKRRVRRHRLVCGDGGEAVVRVIDTLDDSNGIADYDGVVDDEFGVILNGYLASGRAARGRVGGAEAELIDGAELVAFGVDWIVAHAARARPVRGIDRGRGRSRRVGIVQIENGAVVLNVESAGDPSARPLLLLHGITTSVRTWAWFVPQLAERYHVLSLDFRGHGKSGRAPGDYQPAAYVTDAIAVLEQVCSEPAIVIGHSLGGITAATLGQQRGELASALVLEDPPLGSMDSDDVELQHSTILDTFRLMREAVPGAQAAGLPAQALADVMSALPTSPGRTMGEEIPATAILAMAEGLLELDISVLDPVLDQTARSAFSPTTPITVPTLLLTADPSAPDAVAAPAHVAVVAEHSPLVEVHVVAGAGHLIHDSIATRDEFVRQVERFLSLI